MKRKGKVRRYISNLLMPGICFSLLEAGTYSGGGYTVTIEWHNGEASYRGCNAKNQCIEIVEPSWHHAGAYTWENKGYCYCMTPVGKRGDYRLRVMNEKGQTLLRVLLHPVN